MSYVHKWNVNTVSKDGKVLQEWDPTTCFEDILKEFYKIRIPIVEERIKITIKRLEIEKKYLEGYYSALDGMMMQNDVYIPQLVFNEDDPKTLIMR